MAVQQVQNLPPQFIQDIGKDLATQITAQTAVPIVTTGLAGISQRPGESADQFKARQDAARQFDIRQQSLAGLAPTVAAQDALQTQAQQIAQAGVGSFQPFLAQAQQAATDAGFKARQDAARAFTTRQQNLAGIAPKIADQGPLQALAQTKALQGLGSFEPFVQRAQTQADLASGLGTLALGQTAGIGTGAQAFQQDVQQFMSPYQSQVIDATLAEFERNTQIQEQR